MLDAFSRAVVDADASTSVVSDLSALKAFVASRQPSFGRC